jgi:hypothetical protein
MFVTLLLVSQRLTYDTKVENSILKKEFHKEVFIS